MDKQIVSWFQASVVVESAAVDYLTISWWGLPGMLLVLAATGVLRGLQDTVTPFVVAGVGFGANAGLNAVLIYGLGWGLIGSAIGTVIAYAFAHKDVFRSLMSDYIVE